MGDSEQIIDTVFINPVISKALDAVRIAFIFRGYITTLNKF